MNATTNARQPFVSVIIPAFNDGGRLALCLDALGRQTYPQELYEVLVSEAGPRSALSNAAPCAKLPVLSTRHKELSPLRGAAGKSGHFSPPL